MELAEIFRVCVPWSLLSMCKITAMYLSFRVIDENNQIRYIHRLSVTAELCFYYHNLQVFDLGYNDLATHQLSLTCVGRW